MICELALKCATLIAVIYGLRFLGRRAGPRASGLVLGLPSSTAILLVLCGREKGVAPALEMADASLLGLIAAVSLPLAFAWAVGRGRRLPAALAAAVGAYVAVAIGLGLVHPHGSLLSLTVCCGSVGLASYAASRIGLPAETAPHRAHSARWTAALRAIVPSAYVVIVGVVSIVGGPCGAGLVSTFPSMSTVVLAVTHLEEGAASAGRIARALPAANLSTVAFLAAFRFGSPGLGLTWGTLVGYLAALISLAAMEGIPGSIPPSGVLPRRALRPVGIIGSVPSRSPALQGSPRPPSRIVGHHINRIRAPHRRPFAPRLEILPC
jgi:hypothetical protein